MNPPAPLKGSTSTGQSFNVSSNPGGYATVTPDASVPYTPSSTPANVPPPASTSTLPVTPAAPTPVNGAQPSPYFAYQPTSSQNGGDSGFNDANKNLTPVQPTSEDDLFTKYYNQSQQVLDAITESEASAESAANLQSTKDSSATNFDENSKGMAGSSEANAQAANNEAVRQNAIIKAKSDRANAISSLVQNIQKSAQEQANTEKSDNENLSTNYINTQKTMAQNALKTAGAQGHTIDEMQQTDPNGYNQLLQYYNGDRNAMQADWVAGAAAISVDGGKPIQAGSNLIYTFKDPVTGKVFTQTIDTGVPLSADYTTSKDADGNIWLLDKATGVTKQLNGSGGVSSLAASRDALTAGRWAMTSNRIVSNYLKLPAYTLLANASPMLSRIEAAKSVPGSVSDNDLLDSVVKLDTGGQAITEAQVSTILNGQSYADTVNVWQKKLQQGGVLSDDQRNQLFDVAQAVYKNYQKAYTPVYNQASSQLQQSGVPEQYWTLPDLNSLSTVGGTETTVPNALTTDQVDQMTATDFQDALDSMSPDDQAAITGATATQ